MTFTGFILGIFMMAIGLSMVWKTNFWLNTFGDLGHLVGLYNASWASWKVVGMAAMFIGFMVAFNLFQTVLNMTVGRLFFFGI